MTSPQTNTNCDVIVLNMASNVSSLLSVSSNVSKVVLDIADARKRAKAAGLGEDEILRCLLLFQEQLNTENTPGLNSSQTTRTTHLLTHLLMALLWVGYRLLPCILCLAVLLYPVYHWYIDSPCLIPQYLPVAEFTMPVVNCSFCQRFTHVPVINASDITTSEFMNKYAYSSQPLLIKGAALSWPAIDKFSYEYFKELYLQRPEALEEDKVKGQFFAYSSGIRNLEEFVNLSSNDANKKWYIGWSVS